MVAPCFFDRDHCNLSCISFLQSCCGRSLWISYPLHPPPLKPTAHSNLPFFRIISFSCKFMFNIFGASSLYHSVNSIEEEYLREEIQELVHSFPGLNINPKSKSDVTNFLISESLHYEHFIIWHDLINNTISKHPKHPEVTPLEVTSLLEKLRGLPNLFCIVYCHREGAPEIFDSLRSLPCFIVNITQHILSPTEKSDDHIIEKYRKLHQSPDLELRTLSAIIHHYPRIERLFKTRGQVEKRDAKRQKRQRLVQVRFVSPWLRAPPLSTLCRLSSPPS